MSRARTKIFSRHFFRDFTQGISTFPVHIAKGWDDRPAYRIGG
ncbi:DUF1661 domain-containing protein [Porphyromonas gulae]|nr:DUF1661 domain-containing protein [Porphyromonas gulae]